MNKSQKRSRPSQLVVGGHSFIPELGSDPSTDFDTQLEIVNECLDNGINCFDTTYEPERVALGRILETLGRRDEAHIIAWNFFADPGTGRYLVGPQPFVEEHIGKLSDQLRTDCIDMLVVHPVGDATTNRKQLYVAQSWVAAGRAGMLGTWAPSDDPATQFGMPNPYRFMVMPRNIRNPNPAVFASCRRFGWETFATSAFNRGWLLDQLVAVCEEQPGAALQAARARVADALMRFSIHDPNVDHLIVGIRKKEWIGNNLESVEKGPLSAEEMRWLHEVLGRVTEAEKR
ncbi:hypothetical protein GX586_06405 [bacterium]|nr:hypothetical protein [bacterium]